MATIQKSIQDFFAQKNVKSESQGKRYEFRGRPSMTSRNFAHSLPHCYTPFSTKALLQSSQNHWPPPHYVIMTPENIHRFSKINSLNSRKKNLYDLFRNQVLPNPDNRNEPGRFPGVANDYNRQTRKRQMEYYDSDDSDDSDDSTTEESEVDEEKKKFQCNICQTCFTTR